MNASASPSDKPGSGRLLENLMHFGRALRAAGLPIGPGKVLAATEAVQGKRLRGGNTRAPPRSKAVEGRPTPPFPARSARRAGGYAGDAPRGATLGWPDCAQAQEPAHPAAAACHPLRHLRLDEPLQ